MQKRQSGLWHIHCSSDDRDSDGYNVAGMGVLLDRLRSSRIDLLPVKSFVFEEGSMMKIYIVKPPKAIAHLLAKLLK